MPDIPQCASRLGSAVDDRAIPTRTLRTAKRVAARRRRTHLSRPLLRSGIASTAGRRCEAIYVALLAIYCVFVVDYLARCISPTARQMVPQAPLGAAGHPAAVPASAAIAESRRRGQDAAAGRRPYHPRPGDRLHRLWRGRSIVYAASLAILDVERDHPESEIKTFGDALWWASTTVTTVGYGDLHPVTGMGRLVAVALMIGGITLLGIMTATMASWIVAARR